MTSSSGGRPSWPSIRGHTGSCWGEKTMATGHRVFTARQAVVRRIRAAPNRDWLVQQGRRAELALLVDRHLIHDTYVCRAYEGLRGGPPTGSSPATTGRRWTDSSRRSLGCGVTRTSSGVVRRWWPAGQGSAPGSPCRQPCLLASESPAGQPSDRRSPHPCSLPGCAGEVQGAGSEPSRSHFCHLR
jgi:hypothetical protein